MFLILGPKIHTDVGGLLDYFLVFLLSLGLKVGAFLNLGLDLLLRLLIDYNYEFYAKNNF